MNKILKFQGKEPTPPKIQEVSNGDLKEIWKIAEALQNVSDANQAIYFLCNATRNNAYGIDGSICNGIGYLNGLLAERALDLGYNLEFIAKISRKVNNMAASSFEQFAKERRQERCRSYGYFMPYFRRDIWDGQFQGGAA